MGTGPSLAAVADDLRSWRADNGCRLFGVNNTFVDFPLDVHISCDPKWHEHYSPVVGDFEKWHWDESICRAHGYNHVQGAWLDGLSLDPEIISFGHSSGWQALNLAVHYGCDPVLLVGYDMTYRPGEPRHYFDGLSDTAGEYPEPLRKWSLFDKPDRTGLLYDYKNIAEQKGLPEIWNCTPGSAMRWFPMATIGQFM